MTPEPDLEEPESVDLIGVVLSKNPDAKYDAYRICVVDGHVTLTQLKGGHDRLKKSALRIMELDLVAISQGITRGEIEFVGDTDADDI